MKKLNLRSKTINSFVEIPVEFIDSYLPEAPEEALKVYLYLMRASMDSSIILSLQDMADLFDVTPKKIVQALCYWESMRVLSLEYADGEVSDITILPLGDRTESTVSAPSVPMDIPENIETLPRNEFRTPVLPDAPEFDRSTLDDDPVYSDLLNLTEAYLNKSLNPMMRNTIGDAYLLFNKDDELTEFLIEYCIGNGHESPHYLKAVAENWTKEGISNVQDAKKSIASRKPVYRILAAMGIKNREPAGTEGEFISSWLQDFETDVVAEACNRTISKLHTPDFKYADAILKRWKSEGVKTQADIEKLDSKHEETKEARVQTPQKSNSFRNFPERATDYDELLKNYVES